MKIKSILVLLIAIIMGYPAFSQSAFKFKYKFRDVGDTTTYTAFMVSYGDGTGFIRVRYMDNIKKTPILVDLEMEEHYLVDKRGVVDSTKFYYQGTRPFYILGDSTEEYDPEVFWFKENPATGDYDPWGVTVTIGKTVVQGDFIKVDLLGQQDLTKDLILTYFTKDDDIYKNLFETQTRSLTPAEKSEKLNLVVVANTEDESIGRSCVRDKDRAVKTFSELAEFLQIKFNSTVIYGKDYSKANVEKAIRELNPGKEDIVIFYYSGHGFSKAMDESHKYPYLDLRSNPHTQDWNVESINIESIFNSIRSKGARLNLVLSDCCNNDPNSPNNVGVSIAHTRGSGLTWSLDNCRSLFLNPKPISILMTAADKGQEASGSNDDGGFFSNYFVSTLHDHFSKFKSNVNWNEILEDAKIQTIQYVKKYCTKGDVCEQDPFYKLQF